MGFLSLPTALIASAIAVPLLVSLYFLKLQRRQMVVPSTLLWKRAVQDMQVNAPFQKLRKNLLLLLQLLILAALLFAMARPTLQATANPGQRVVIVIDHSASMNATDTAGVTRLEQAKDAALDLVNNLDAEGHSAGGGAMVVSFAQRTRVLSRFTTDQARLRQAIRSIKPTDQLSRLAPALRVIEPEAVAGAAMVVYILSDGRVHLAADDQQALSGAKLMPIMFGNSADQTNNVALVSFSSRRDFDKPQVVQVFARLANYGPNQVEANINLSLDGQLLRVQPITLPGAAASKPDAAGRTLWSAPGTKSVQFDFVLPGSAMIELSHDQEDDLAADNAAWLMLAPARRVRVLLVSEGNGFLEQVIRSVGVRELAQMTPQKFEDQDPQQLRRGGWDTTGLMGASGEGFDVIVFDSYAPTQAPLVDSLFFGAVPPVEGLAIVPISSDQPQTQVILDWQRDDALLRYVALDDVVLSQPGRITLPQGSRVLATGLSGPLLAKVPGEGGTQYVVSSFGILYSNWPLQVSFPVFLSNIVQTLGLGALADEAGMAYRTGELAIIPVRDQLTSLTYAGPMSLHAPQVAHGTAVLPVFTRVGVYQTQDAIEPPHDRLAVNLLDSLESDLRPAANLEIGTTTLQGLSRSTAIRREIWPWFAWAAMAVLMLEWFVYTRRMHL
jgi:hypothetical protein